jgi:hypothetical protein
MDHEFELAFNLLDEAAGRIQQQQYGITRIPFHNHGDIALTTVHDYTPHTGHHLVLLAADDHGQMVAIEATAADLNAEPVARILKVRAGDLTFHATSETWTYRAHHRGHTYTLAARISDEPMWTVTVDDGAPQHHDDLDTAMSTVLDHHGALAA